MNEGNRRVRRRGLRLAFALSAALTGCLGAFVACGGLEGGRAPSSAATYADTDVFDDGVRRVAVEDLLVDFEARNAGCIGCHEGVDDPHVRSDGAGGVIGGRRVMGCVDCHGGDGAATTIEAAHPRPSDPAAWPGSANPERLWMRSIEENWDWIRFVNPGDLRVAQTTCGTCHPEQVLAVSKSVMTTSAPFYGVAGYANGILSSKRTVFGESYGPDGAPRRVNGLVLDAEQDVWRLPTDAEIARHGLTGLVMPLPHFEITQPGNVFRVFEQGSRLGGAALGFNGLATPLPGLPDKFEDPGRPNNRLSDRGLGTLNRVDLPMLNLHKTRLNDPHLSHFGTNDHPGDYRSSGCSACHVVYANDRDPFHAGPYAAAGNRGTTRPDNPDPTIPRGESGHPLAHELTTRIPSSQCMTCHMHQPNAFVNAYYGFQMWTYETDGEALWPKEQARPTHDEYVARLERNPEEAATRGLWGDRDFLVDVAPRLNPTLKHTQFADYHGHGWMFRAVFKTDRKGNLLDADGRVIDYDDPEKFHGVVPLAPDAAPRTEAELRRAVHMKDVHAERGMHCVDCHVGTDVHGDGALHAEFQAAVQISCRDCHGTVQEYATLTASGPAAETARAFGRGAQDLQQQRTPFGEPQFEAVLEDGSPVVIQRSMIEKDRSWRVSQVKDSVLAGHPEYNRRAAWAKTVRRDGETWGDAQDVDPAELAHADSRMECYACHTSWVTSCFGCHLPQKANMRTETHRHERETLRNFASYNPQVARDDVFMLGIAGDVKHNRVAPVRSSSAVLISSEDAQRRIIYGQIPPTAANGMSSQIFNTHFPHTVRKTETRACADCHVSADEDNNAWLAQTYLLGTAWVDFVGRNAWVGTDAGPHAVRVTEWDEPQAVIGSDLHRLAYPDDFARFVAGGRALERGAAHDGGVVHALELRGEYLYTACGPDGFRVYDVANIDNKDFSQKFVTAPVSPLGQDTHVALPDARDVALPTNNPVSMSRRVRPENDERTYTYRGREQNLHETYRYAYVADARRGLVVIDVDALSDGDPENNFLEVAASFDGGGALAGARTLVFAGDTIWLGADAGVFAIDVADPRAPRIVARLDAEAVPDPRALVVQFRYLFAACASGLVVIDVTRREAPEIVARLAIADARDLHVGRTWGFVAGGGEGLVIVDLERPREPRIDRIWDAEGRIDDLEALRVSMVNDSVYAWLADGRNGLRVASLVTPGDGGRSAYGFAPRPEPRLLATYAGSAPARSLARGLERDRAVDEAGHQMAAFGRIGGRPLDREERERLFLRDGEVWRVRDEPPAEDGDR